MCTSCSNISPINRYFVFLLFFVYSAFPVRSLSINDTTQNSERGDHEAKKLSLIRAQLMKINKPAVKTIQSPDGDMIDCVLTHKQPAFDHPLLQGQMPLGAPKRPKRYQPTTSILDEKLQAWSMSNETCPEGTIPIRRAIDQDLLRKSSIQQFPRKLTTHAAGGYDPNNTHEHALVYVDDIDGPQYYGAKASMSVWAPFVANKQEFSVSQFWISAGNHRGGDLNTIEAGWQVYGDNAPRLFIYWTRDSYKSTGCYNLHCSGFVQTNPKVVLGGALSPTSTYNGDQYIIELLVWKDPKSGNWWLSLDKETIGYWPSFIFTHLAEHADALDFGGEIINLEIDGTHTSTQMGSGHFAEEGYKRAALFRNLEFVDKGNGLNAIRSLKVVVTRSNCYDLQTKFSEDWGTYFYYGGPGKNQKCPY